MPVFKWSKTPVNNATADSTINWAEGMAPSAVNDSARAEMAAVAKWRDDISGTLTTSGSSTVYSLTTNSTFDSLANMSGAMITFIPHTTSGAAPTLNVDGLGAKQIRSATGTNVATGALISGTPYQVTYINASTEFILMGYTETFANVTATGTLGVTGASTFTGAVNFNGGGALSTGTYTGAATFSGNVIFSGAPSFTGSPTFTGGIAVTMTPQGYLTPTSLTPVIAADVTAAISIFYTPFVGNVVPIYDGTNMIQKAFSELTLSLASQHTLNSHFDVFVFLNSGVVTIGTGPAWTTITAGSGARGTGAGTTQLSRANGLWTNAVSMTARNGASTFTVAANQGTYVGSLYIDGTAGQVTCHRSFGQSRKWGVWNAYNRQPIILQMGDTTASWVYSTGTVRQSNAAAGNTVAVFTGLAEEAFDVSFNQVAITTTSGNAFASIGIGWNVTNAFSGKRGTASSGNPANNPTFDLVARYVNAPALGLNNVNALESGNGNATATFQGGNDDMQLTVAYRG